MPKRDRWDNEISEERCTLAARLKDARINARMTLAEAADAASVSSPTISRYESADIAIPVEKLSALATAYGVSPAYLMGWERPLKDVITIDGRSITDTREKELLELAKGFPDEDFDALIAFLKSMRSMKGT
nr:MAG TPA: helix-turn-helix domain protein [Caudoviricetes sp.]